MKIGKYLFVLSLGISLVSCAYPELDEANISVGNNSKAYIRYESSNSNYFLIEFPENFSLVDSQLALGFTEISQAIRLQVFSDELLKDNSEEVLETLFPLEIAHDFYPPYIDPISSKTKVLSLESSDEGIDEIKYLAIEFVDGEFAEGGTEANNLDLLESIQLAHGHSALLFSEEESEIILGEDLFYRTILDTSMLDQNAALEVQQLENIQDFRFSPPKDMPLDSIYGVKLSYSFSPEESMMQVSETGDFISHSIAVELSGFSGFDGATENRTEYWNQIIRPGDHTLYFYVSSKGFEPENLVVSSSVPGFEVKSLSYIMVDGDERFSDFYVSNSGDVETIPLSLEKILDYPQAYWRVPDFEVFSWNLYPDIKIFDFKNLTTQARFFKRLAFFVEKEGYRGELLSDGRLQSLHGWNAHNYRAQGLAEFFSKAAGEGMELSSEEYWLRKFLEYHGILIRIDQNQWREGIGGIISVTSDPNQFPGTRQLLLGHEALHGIFYMEPEFRALSEEIYAGMPSERRSFLHRFFKFMNYETSDEYLMINEYQAYLMQQSIKNVRWYFSSRIPSRLSGGAENSSFHRQGRQFADAFYSDALILSRWLYKNTGIINETLFGLP